MSGYVWRKDGTGWNAPPANGRDGMWIHDDAAQSLADAVNADRARVVRDDAETREWKRLGDLVQEGQGVSVRVCDCGPHGMCRCPQSEREADIRRLVELLAPMVGPISDMVFDRGRFTFWLGADAEPRS